MTPEKYILLSCIVIILIGSVIIFSIRAFIESEEKKRKEEEIEERKRKIEKDKREEKELEFCRVKALELLEKDDFDNLRNFYYFVNRYYSFWEISYNDVNFRPFLRTNKDGNFFMYDGEKKYLIKRLKEAEKTKFLGACYLIKDFKDRFNNVSIQDWDEAIAISEQLKSKITDMKSDYLLEGKEVNERNR